MGQTRSASVLAPWTVRTRVCRARSSVQFRGGAARGNTGTALTGSTRTVATAHTRAAAAGRPRGRVAGDTRACPGARQRRAAGTRPQAACTAGTRTSPVPPGRHVVDSKDCIATARSHYRQNDPEDPCFAPHNQKHPFTRMPPLLGPTVGATATPTVLDDALPLGAVRNSTAPAARATPPATNPIVDTSAALFALS